MSEPLILSDMLQQLNRLWNNGELAVVREIMSEDFVRHDPNVGLIEGQQAMADYVRGMRVQYPDLVITFEETLHDGAYMVSHWHFSGTDLGRHYASKSAPTGKRVVFKGVDLLRLQDGKIAEDYAYFDRLSVLRQLGIIAEEVG